MWIALTVFGMFSSRRGLEPRWYKASQSHGYSAYERTSALKTFGTGEQAPSSPSSTRYADLKRSRCHCEGDHGRSGRQSGLGVSSYWSTGSRIYVSKDGHTAFARSVAGGLRLRRRPTSQAVRAQKLLADTPHRDSGLPHRPRRARGGVVGRERPECAHRGADRRARRARRSSSSIFGTLPAVLMPILALVLAIKAAVLNLLSLMAIRDHRDHLRSSGTAPRRSGAST